MTETWMNAPWIETYQDYDYTDEPINLSDLAWFDVKILLNESDIEKKENIEAMRQQVALGILQPNGLPVGMNVPQATVSSFNSSRKLTPAFKMPTSTNRHFNPIGTPPTTPIKNIFQQARNNMSRLDELTRDRRKA
jgi:hypothetical protein